MSTSSSEFKSEGLSNVVPQIACNDANWDRNKVEIEIERGFYSLKNMNSNKFCNEKNEQLYEDEQWSSALTSNMFTGFMIFSSMVEHGLSSEKIADYCICREDRNTLGT